MMRPIRLFALLLAGLAAAGQAPRGFFPWWESPLAGGLNLTEDQRQQIRATVRECRPRLIDLRAAVEKAEGEVADAFNDPSIDQRRGMEAIERLIAARGDLTRAISEMTLRLRLVLTPRQWQELQERRRQGEGGPPGPGMMRERMQRWRDGRPPGAKAGPEDRK
jgi:Spy/CpxP family protein refolding chaperone